MPISLEMIEDDKVFRSPGDRFQFADLMMRQDGLQVQYDLGRRYDGAAFAKQVTVWPGQRRFQGMHGLLME